MAICRDVSAIPVRTSDKLLQSLLQTKLCLLLRPFRGQSLGTHAQEGTIAKSFLADFYAACLMLRQWVSVAV